MGFPHACGWPVLQAFFQRWGDRDAVHKLCGLLGKVEETLIYSQARLSAVEATCTASAQAVQGAL